MNSIIITNRKQNYTTDQTGPTQDKTVHDMMTFRKSMPCNPVDDLH